MSSSLSIAKRMIIEPFVRGRVVHDLGAGDLVEAKMLVEMGAEQVHAIDCRPMPKVGDFRITRHTMRFDDWRHEGYMDVAFVSWPINHDTGIERLLRSARTVIYHGKCTDGTMCGYPAMWQHLTQREVLAHEHNPVGTLIVYGRDPALRKPLPEEMCGLDLERVWSYSEAYGAAESVSEAVPQ